jgi:citrate synthase
MLGIPEVLYTPLFACARIAGWCAHRIEEALTGKRLVRPGYQAAIRPRPYIPIEER